MLHGHCIHDAQVEFCLTDPELMHVWVALPA